MELYKPKLTYLSLKRTLETEKYKKRYEKTLTPSFMTNRLRVNSLRHIRKASQCNLKENFQKIESQGSVLFHSSASSQVSESNTCMNSCVFAGIDKEIQTESSDKRFLKGKEGFGRGFDQKKTDGDKEDVNEILLLKEDLMQLKSDVLGVQKFLHLQRLRKNVKDALVADKENLAKRIKE